MIEKALKKTDGVSHASANYGTESVQVSYDEGKISPDHLSHQIEPLGYSLILSEDHSAHTGVNESKEYKLKELQKLKTKVVSILPLAAITIVIMAIEVLMQFETISEIPAWLEEAIKYSLPLMATYALFVVGQPYLLGFYRFLRYGKANMDSLIGLGTLTAYIYSIAVSVFESPLSKFIDTESTYFDVTIVVIAFITLGKFLEARSKLKTGDAIEKLLNLQTKTAIVVRNGVETEVAVDTVVHGDLVRVKPGGRIPVDGIISEGESYIDEAMVTGEPLPVKKTAGDAIVAGTINTTGTFLFKATKVGSETMLSHIIKMVEEAQGSKAPIQALADKISGIFVPIVLFIAFISLGLWLLIGTNYLGFSQALSFGLVSFVSILVIACPCALGLATPTAIIVGVGRGAKEGILIKDAATLEKLHKVKTVVVDKTGTITKGKPELISIQNFGTQDDDTLIGILASLEKNSEHPIAHAITLSAKEKGIPVPVSDKFEAMKGKGIKGTINGTEYYAGSVKLIADLGLAFDRASIEKETKEGKTPVILATKKAVIGIALVADAIKPESVDAIKRLHELHMKVVMVTGDDENTAKYIANIAGIDEVVAGVLPEEKLLKIKELQKTGMVAMAGDGVNDAPALAQADVGIAMATGTDVAIESAGITLLHGDLSKMARAVALSKNTMRGIKQNLFWAFFYNVVGIPLAAGLFYPLFGWLLSPIFAGLAMALSSVSVVGNSLRLKTKKI